MDEIEIVVAHRERTTMRVGETFLKVDGEAGRVEREAQVIGLAPVPTPAVLWQKPHVLALTAVPGTPLGTLGGTASTSPAAWAATGAAIRRLHDAPPPPWTGPALDEVREELDRECAWLLENQALPAEIVHRNREIAEAALRPWAPRFVHGDLQIAHVFVEDDAVTGIIDWSEGAAGDAQSDLATLTLGHEERLEDLLAGYGEGADREIIRGWWSLRSLTVARWLLEHGFDPDAPGCEFDVLRARMRED
ncbi:phosphotransferase family protein [Brachybacterium sp. YJGR34]|uniref:phosphotransferase family protein n=1 Tax=Brachybacterium sp. YJGR34 TaxID=2059911 RepID=UPI000E0AED86|nr:phosphotransferase [Brachybacterium sp. YJGR34]